MILGIGIDILDIRRIEKLFLKFGERFEKKFYTENELNFAKKRKSYIETLAKMFSIKESVFKAISNVSGISPRDIEIFHDENGKPSVKLSRNALKIVNAKACGGEFLITVSVSDEIPYACSFVIISQ
ncbi:MAG: holo-ACP synthase [Holosporales bacterium]|jgi:holo-[acyl-carrier protein] synthase|nr:holo-ACP synthase [Holosporales bacterium]